MIERIEKIVGWNSSNPEEYELRVNGDKINVSYSSYGISLGWTKEQKFVAYSCNEGNNFFFLTIRFDKKELDYLIKGEDSIYDWVWKIWR